MKIKFPLHVLQPIKDYLFQQEKKLKKRKRELQKEDPYQNEDRLLDNAAPDTDAAEESGHERVSALKKEVDKSLIRIRKALTRIKLGNYGLCTKCGKMINTDRLAVDPTAEYCVKCQKKIKSKQK